MSRKNESLSSQVNEQRQKYRAKCQRFSELREEYEALWDVYKKMAEKWKLQTGKVSIRCASISRWVVCLLEGWISHFGSFIVLQH